MDIILLKSTLRFCANAYPSFFKGILELKIGSLESAKIVIGFLEYEKSGPYKSIPGA